MSIYDYTVKDIRGAATMTYPWASIKAKSCLSSIQPANVDLRRSMMAQGNNCIKYKDKGTVILGTTSISSRNDRPMWRH